MNNWEYFEKKYGAPIGRGAQCRVYRRDDTVDKVLSEGHDIVTAMHEGFALATAESLGIPVSNIHGVYTEGGHIVMEMDYVSGDTLTGLITAAGERGDAAAIDKYLDEFTQLQLQLHSRPAGGLGDMRRSYGRMLRDCAVLPEKLRENLLRLVEGLPDGDALCHNDYHPLNVIRSGGRYVIIDWDSAMIGDAAGDVAHSYLVSRMMDAPLASVYPDYAERYLQKYTERSGMDVRRVKAWLPLHAAILYNALVAGAPENAALMAAYFQPLV